MGGRLHPGGTARLRLARPFARRRAHRGRARQRDVGRTPLPHRPAHRLPRAGPRTGHGADVPGPARRHPQGRQRRVRRAARAALSRDHRGHDARRARQLHGRPSGQPVRPARAELRRRRGMRIGARGHRLIGRRPREPPVRHRDRRWRRPQHGRVELREVLQDRGAVGDRHPSLRRRCRRLRDGRGCRRVRAEKAGRRRTRRRQHLRGPARHRRCQRRAGQGDHRPESGRSAPGRAAGLAQLRAVTGVVRDDRVPRYVDPRRRRRRGHEHRRGIRRRRAPRRVGGHRLGQVEHRPPQGRRRSCRLPQGGLGDPSPGAAAQPPRRDTEPQHRLGRVAVRGQHRAAPLGPADRRHPHRRRQRVRVRGDQLPRRARGVRARARARRRAEVRGGGRRAVHVRRRAGHGRILVIGWSWGRDRRCGAEGSPAWCPGARRRRRSRARCPPADGACRRDRGARSCRHRAARHGSARRRAHRHRLRRRRRPRRQGRAGDGRVHPASPLEGPARARHLPRQRSGPEGRLPVHRPGLAVRQHAGRAARRRADRRRRLRPGGRRDDPAARPVADVLSLRRCRRPRRRHHRRSGSAPHRDHPARRAVRRSHARPGCSPPMASSPTS